MTRGKGRKGRALRVTAPTALSYRGPIVGSLANYSMEPVEVVLAIGGSYAVSPSTSLAFTFTNKGALAGVVGVQGTQGWAPFSQLYDEFRVLGLEVMIPPTAALTGSLIALFAQRPAQDGFVLPTTLALASQYDDFRFANNVTPTTMEVRMSGSDEASWQSTDTTATVDDVYTGVGIWNGDATTLPIVGKWRVQFRSTKATSLGKPGTVAKPLGLTDVEERLYDTVRKNLLMKLGSGILASAAGEPGPNLQNS